MKQHKLELVQWGIIPIHNYNGVLVQRIFGEGYKVLGKVVSSPQMVDDVIKAAEQSLENSLK